MVLSIVVCPAIIYGQTASYNTHNYRPFHNFCVKLLSDSARALHLHLGHLADTFIENDICQTTFEVHLSEEGATTIYLAAYNDGVRGV